MEKMKEDLKRGYMSATIMKLFKVNNSVTPLEVKKAMKNVRPEMEWPQAEITDYMTAMHFAGDLILEDDGSYKPYLGITKKIVSVKKHPNTGAKLKNIKMTPISKAKALDLMTGIKGGFFTAEFEKKDGTLRVMNCQALKTQTSRLGYVQVKETSKMRTNPDKAFRNINLQTLKSLKISGKAYKVN